ncbi:MAG TPA: hypothetical protein VFE62_18745 [Gemmataceae bacterium]|nr:hypothetical protein [Gemmataceae bacterium]
MQRNIDECPLVTGAAESCSEPRPSGSGPHPSDALAAWDSARFLTGAARTILLVLVFGFASVACAQDRPADLIKKLSSSSYVERERAARALEKIGKSALPILAEALDSVDLETRRRVLILMDRIEDKEVVTQLLTPTPITLRFDQVPVSQALSETGKAMRLPIGTYAGKDEKVGVDLKNVPYWQAWQQVRSAARLQESDWTRGVAKLVYFFGDVEISRDDLPPARFPNIQFDPKAASYAEDNRTSIRIRVKWHAVDDHLVEDQRHAILAIEVRPEPRIEVASIPQVQITKIVDAAGKDRNAKATALFGTRSNRVDILRTSMFVGEIQYAGLLHRKAIRWEGEPKSLKEAHGKVQMDVMQRPTMIEVPHVAKAIGKQHRGMDGVKLTVVGIDTEEDDEVLVRLRLDNIASLAPTTPEKKVVRVRPGLIAVRGAMDVAMERLRLRDNQGWWHAPLMKSEYKCVDTEKECYEASLYFNLPPGGMKECSLVLTKEPRTVPLEMPFVVRDVAYPK